MERFMIEAIREFRREFKGCEIRTIAAWEMSGYGDDVDYALFSIEYVEVPCGDYKAVRIRVEKPYDGTKKLNANVCDF